MAAAPVMFLSCLDELNLRAHFPFYSRDLNGTMQCSQYLYIVVVVYQRRSMQIFRMKESVCVLFVLIFAYFTSNSRNISFHVLYVDIA